MSNVYGDYEVSEEDGMVTMTDEIYRIKLSPLKAKRLGERLIVQVQQMENPDGQA